MRITSGVILTAESGARRVNAVPELSTLSADDRRVMLSPAARAARQRIAPFVSMALPQIASARQALPSYVAAAVDGLLAAFSQWERDEHEVTQHGA